MVYAEKASNTIGERENRPTAFYESFSSISTNGRMSNIFLRIFSRPELVAEGPPEHCERVATACIRSGLAHLKRSADGSIVFDGFEERSFRRRGILPG